MTFDDFVEAVSDMSVPALREAVVSETGRAPKGRGREEVLASAFELYQAAEAGTLEPTVPEAPAPDVDAPQPPEAFAPDVDAPDAPARPIMYEGRSRTGMHFTKAGVRFPPKWHPIGPLTDAQLARIREFDRFCQVRIAR